MRHLKIAGFATVVAVCSACNSQNSNDGSGRGGIQVGDSLRGGTVVDTSPVSAGCQQVTVETAPAWECSREQTRAAQGEDSDGRAIAAVPVLREDLSTTSCADLAGLRRPILKAAQRQALQQQRSYALRPCLPTRASEYVAVDGGGTCSPYGGYGFSNAGASYSPSSAVPPGALPSPVVVDSDDGASEYSTTNTQVLGVDEADFVKNDAGYVYVLAQNGLHVIDAWPAADTHEVARLSLPGTATRLFLYNDKLVVYARNGGTSGAPSQAAGCTYGYDCRFTAEPGSTTVYVYDVSAPASPRELRSYELSGSYVASRRVGDHVYTVVIDEGPSSAPGLSTDVAGSDPDEVDDKTALRLAEANAAVDALDDAYFLPKVAQQVQGQTSQPVDDCSQALSASAADGTSFTSLITFDLTTLATPTRTLVASRPGFVYASGEALYIAADGLGGGPFAQNYGAAPDEQTTLHKFDLLAGRTRYAGSGKVAGHVLNQFSMDEQAGVLRIATSIGRVPDPNVTSSVTTFGVQNGKLVQLGAVTGIAPMEDIRSVRFDGDRGFVVTFKKTDPLFVLDLADATRPKVLGELKIPGFSTYMQPMDHDHLLAVGFDADDQGSFAFFNGIQIQIFDVSDLSMPKLMHKATIGTRGSASEGLTNHLAFNYFPQKALLALPMTICEGGGNGLYGDALTFSGLMVFDVSLRDGIREHGRMPFVDPASLTNVSCGTWWTQGTSEVKRSIFMDDFAIGISDTMYGVAPLSELAKPLKWLPLTGG